MSYLCYFSPLPGAATRSLGWLIFAASPFSRSEIRVANVDGQETDGRLDEWDEWVAEEGDDRI